MIDGLSSFFAGVSEDVKEFATERPITTAGIGVGVLGTTGLVVAGLKAKRTTTKRKKATSKTKKTGRKIKHTRRGWRQDQKRVSKQKWEKAYQKRKKKGKGKKTKKRVGKTYYTKKGQPYKILSSGKAKFIKKKRR